MAGSDAVTVDAAAAPEAAVRRLAHAVLMPGFVGTSAPPWLLAALREGLGGVCYFGHNITSPGQLAALSAEIHTAGAALTAMDEEGGGVSRLHVRDGSPHVGAAVLGRADDLALTRAVAAGIAGEVRAAGVDIALAPVVDVNSDPANPVIGVRSFGADPELVGRHAAAFVRALQAEGVAACAKHFPGHGDTKVDSHAGLPVVGVDLETLRARELVPFAAAVAAGARCVMTSHIVFPALDEELATVSPAVLGLLRDDLAFTGVIVSDAIDMRAVSGTIGFAEGVVRALAAGVDLVCLGNPVNPAGAAGPPDDGADDVPRDEREFRTAADAVVAAVREGRLPLGRLEDAAARVRALREWSAAAVPGDSSDHRTDVAGAGAAAAARALHPRGDVAGALKGPVRIADLRRRRVVPGGRMSDLVTEALLERLPGSTAEVVFARTADAEGRVSDAELAAPDRPVDAEDTPEPADVLLVGTPGTDPAEDAELARRLALHPGAVVLCLGWPGDLELALPGARNAVFTFGVSRPTARAVAALLTD